MDLRVGLAGKDEREADPGGLGRMACGEENAQRLRVDEGRLGKVDDDADPPVDEERELILETRSGIGIVLADERDDAGGRVLLRDRDGDRCHAL